MRYFKLSSLVLSLILLPIHSSAEDSLVTAKPALQREILSGFTRARTRIVLSAENAGRIASVNADVGDLIREDEPFACQDQTFINMELRSNRAERDALTVDKAYFRKEVARYRQLLKQNSSSQSQLDSALRSLDKTDTQLAALTVAAEILQERKARLCIKAPAGWSVVKRYIEPGEWVNTGEPVVDVGDYNSLVVPFALSMAEYRALKSLQAELKLYLPELQSEVDASILRISPAFDEVSRKINIELEITVDQSLARGGLRVELALDIPMRNDAVLVPEHALRQRYEQYWLQRADGEEIRVVYLGQIKADDGTWIRVSGSGIKPGDQFQLHQEQ
ncbi:MAG: efflux RND transporter periplasmic adaptor subunit [Candidatus Thiodiazotropha sp.]